MSIETLETRISEAEQARHDLATGALRSFMVQNRTYTLATIAELTAYITVLKQELADRQAEEGAGDGWGAYGIEIGGAR